METKEVLKEIAVRSKKRAADIKKSYDTSLAKNIESFSAAELSESQIRRITLTQLAQKQKIDISDLLDDGTESEEEIEEVKPSKKATKKDVKKPTKKVEEDESGEERDETDEEDVETENEQDLEDDSSESEEEGTEDTEESDETESDSDDEEVEIVPPKTKGKKDLPKANAKGGWNTFFKNAKQSYKENGEFEKLPSLVYRINYKYTLKLFDPEAIPREVEGEYGPQYVTDVILLKVSPEDAYEEIFEKGDNKGDPMYQNDEKYNFWMNDKMSIAFGDFIKGKPNAKPFIYQRKQEGKKHIHIFTEVKKKGK